MPLSTQDIKEIERRRTFAIISHPDAGKTTLTEKLLLYGGAIHEAGEVKAKKERRSARSDWMKLEQERGISVSTSVMQFDYRDLKINLLDTPGHADFSEDTYRTLAAVDSAVMVLDNAKGVERQTKKLFTVTRLRNTPIFTFINKMDREGRSPFDHMDEVEKILNITCNPVTWPIGNGPTFQGVYHRLQKRVFLFEPQGFGTKAVSELEVKDLRDKALGEIIGDELQQQLINDIELVDGTLGEFNVDDFLSSKMTPIFFGSARTNFGVQVFLDFFTQYSPPPQAQRAIDRVITPTEQDFSGFVFKIQANMDKNHRDRIAFIRIASGKFERGMYAKHARLEKEIRLSHSAQFLARDRTNVEVAYAGDIIGLHDNGQCKIGDSLYVGPRTEFADIPQFSPEFFSKVEIADPIRRKQLQKGIEQLCEEGTIQLFVDPRVGTQDPVLGAVGMLQFEVFSFRLSDEYGVEVRLRPQPYKHARWIRYKDGRKGKPADVKGSVTQMEDHLGNLVGLFTSDFNLDWCIHNNLDLVFLESSVGNVKRDPTA